MEQRASYNPQIQIEEARVLSIADYIRPLSHTLVIKDQSGWHVIPFDCIIRCQAASNYSIVYLTDGGQILTSMTLKRIEQKLQQGNFLRTHQSHLIAVDQIRRFDSSGSMTLSDKSVIPVSRRKRAQINRLFSIN